MNTIAQAFNNWKAEILPDVIKEYGKDDVTAIAESWNNYTDSLCKDGELGDLQYEYAPAWDDDMPDDDREFILEAMGLHMSATRVIERPDGNGDWSADASHWRILLQRRGAELSTHYSMGSAHTGEPDAAGVIYSLLSDSDGVEGETFEDWAENLGYDTDSRRAERTFKACQDTAARLKLLFSANELEQLRELFADY